MPFGSVPLKVEANVMLAEAAGAGAGNVSPAVILVGLKVPEVRVAAVKDVAAASSKVIVTLVTSIPLPTSERIIMFAPLGATSRISMSGANVWLMLFNVTVMLVTVPVIPPTLMFDG